MEPQIQDRSTNKPAVPDRATDLAAYDRSVPEALADVALIDGRSAAAAACTSYSQFLALVRKGAAPQPCIKQPRYTRWRSTDIRSWLEGCIQSGRLQAVGGATLMKRPYKKDAAQLEGAALPEALIHAGNEEARWQAGSRGTRDKKHSADCAAISRGLPIAPGVTIRVAP